MIYNSESNILRYLKKAIKTNGFEYSYQPIYNYSDDKYSSVEILTRLKDKQIDTELFINIAEKYNLIHILDLLALKNACKSIKIFHSNNILIDKIYINFSPVTFKRKNLLNEIKTILKEFNVNPNFIGIEITEFLEIPNILEFNSLINKILEFGIEISLDDFGSYNSNIQRLMEIKFTSLKLDKSIVSKINSAANSKVILKLLKFLSDELGIYLIAEGIESKNEFDCLKEYGVNYFQGYYLSKPLTQEEIILYLGHTPKIEG